MPIKIRLKSKGLYSVKASPPDTDREWSTSEPLSVGEVINELYAIGAHQTDIGDAFYEADPHLLS